MPYIGRHLDRGNYLKLDDISSSFDGVETTFNLTNGGSPFYPGSAFSILVVLAGVIQEAESAYQIDQSQITFASAPLASDSFFCIVLGTALGINVPGNGTVGGTQLTKPFSYDGFFYLNDTTNRVGINSSSPTTALDVQGTVTATEFVGNLSNTSGISTFYNLTVENDLTVNGSFSTLDTIVTEVDKLEVGANNTTVGVAITQSGSGDILRLYDSSTQVVTVADGGNVGIGTDNPGQKLHISGSTGTNIQVQQTNGSLYLGSSGSTRFGLSSGANVIQSASVDFAIGSQSGHNLVLGTDNTERLRITSSGNIGINTTGPNATLTVGPVNSPTFNRGSVAIKAVQDDNSLPANLYLEELSGAEGYVLSIDSDGDLNFHNSGASSPTVTFSDDDNVGIGEDSPDVRLHVKEQFDTAYDLTSVTTESNHLFKLENPSTTANAFAGMHFRVGSGADLFFGAIQQSVNDGDFFFANQNSPQREMMRIKSTGKVGIGITNPYHQLHIQGSGDTRALITSGGTGDAVMMFENASGNTWGHGIDLTNNNYVVAYNSVSDPSLTVDGILEITTSGNIGINTDSPADTLDVNGNVLPSFDATHDLGSASKRWNNVYTTDLQLSNEGSSNDVDGSWGRWTIQEGEDDLFLINRRNGKKYKFVLQEVN